MAMKKIRKLRSDEPTNYDLSISDLMAALLLIFILLLSTQLLQIKQQAEGYKNKQKELVDILKKEFSTDLKKWHAEIDEHNITIRFIEPEIKPAEIKSEIIVGFKPESAILTNDFKHILSDFFPRYVQVIYRFNEENSKSYLNGQDLIDEIRIEGHTANPGNRYSDKKGYSDSIRLSQQRANNVLFYVMDILENGTNNYEVNWVKRHIAASGFAYAKPILNDDSQPNWERSRRVEFSVRLKYDTIIKNYSD